jgi:type IV pilus assembly protein PilQ
MESENKGRVVTSPKIITENNQQAQITNTETAPFAVVTSDAGGNLLQSFEEATASISLSVTPKVTNEGAIALEVDITKGGFGTPDTIGARPPTTSNQIKTKVLVDNGSTVVIGGLYKTEDRQIESGIPFLKDLPLIGWLFKSAYNPKKTRSELIVFLTPRIINQKEAGLVNRNDAGLIE